jgi:predicted 3-demethylubiquinone-9 3-methyltransferase (glyoxalase superfamily)
VQKITPNLWFDSEAEEAAKFYVSLFKNSSIGNVMRYDEASSKVSGRPAGSVLTVEFQLEGQDFVALNGGPIFKFNESVSFQIDCDTQQEVDYFWEKLGDGGEYQPCGWLKDRYGLSWQVVPKVLNELLAYPDKQKAQRVTEAMLQMQKLDIAALEQASRSVAAG